MPSLKIRVANGAALGAATVAVEAEDGAQLVGAADVEVICHEHLKEPAGPAGTVEHEGP